MKKIKKELSRDLLALGSIIFYILVLGRALIGPYWTFFNQLIIGALVLVFIYLFYKKADYYTSRALILVVFTILFYDNLIYNVFAIFVFFLVLISSYYSGNRLKDIFFGFVFGAFSSLIGYYLTIFI